MLMSVAARDGRVPNHLSHAMDFNQIKINKETVEADDSWSLPGLEKSLRHDLEIGDH